MAPTVQIALRLEGELVQLADSLAALIGKRAAGVKPTRSAVLKEAIGRGLRQMSAELDRRPRKS